MKRNVLTSGIWEQRGQTTADVLAKQMHAAVVSRLVTIVHNANVHKAEHVGYKKDPQCLFCFKIWLRTEVFNGDKVKLSIKSVVERIPKNLSQGKVPNNVVRIKVSVINTTQSMSKHLPF